MLVKKTLPPAKWPSGRRSPARHVGSETPVEDRETADQPRMPLETLEEKIPLADAGREIETWRPLTNEKRDACENLSHRDKESVMQQFTDFTENALRQRSAA